MAKTFTDIFQAVNEKLITFGGKAYPKSGHVVIIAGGAGSGKGFIKSNLLGIEGFTFDVDHLKSLSMRAPKLIQKIKDETGHDISKFKLTKSGDVSILHDIIGTQLKLQNKKLTALYTTILTTTQHEKPNIIFDVTLKNLTKLDSISRGVEQLGYDKKNIHIVWVLNDVEVAKAQNLNPNRGRAVDVDILINTHQGVSQTMAQIVGMGDRLTKFMDGAIVIAFNKAFVDTELAQSPRGGSYLKQAEYIYLKKAGKPPVKRSDLGKDILQKIATYAPPVKDWSWK
jgi:hypothetical protein